MILLLWLLGLLIVAILIRQLLINAPKNGKPFLLRIAIVVILVAAIAFAMKGLIPVSASLLGGLFIYAKPVLNALGLWQAWSARKKRKNNDKPQANQQGVMDADTARKILGVATDANEEEIIAAYKSMMAKNHPDKGGSDFLATQINQAKDTLLK